MCLFLSEIKKIISLIIIILKSKIIVCLIKKNFKNLNIIYIRESIEKLGPVFIKFSQILSTRTDIFPKAMTKEFEKLQTHVKPISFSKITPVLKKTDTYNIFKKINENPLASASVAQIHAGVLNNNKKVIIKILKTETKKKIDVDIRILYKLSKIVNFFFSKFKRLKLIDIIDEIKLIFEIETNLINEANNLKKIKSNFKNFKYIYIPNINLDTIKNEILIIEYIDGVNILNKEKLIKEKIALDNIIELMLEIFYTQVFKHDLFHADLHPGNILISKNTYMKPIIILIDFGIVSNFKKEEKIYLGENIIAFTRKNYKKIIHLHLKAGTISNKNIDIAEKKLANIIDPILNKNLNTISFKKTIISLLDLSTALNAQIQPKMILFQKTLISIESLCRNLNNEINLWKITKKIMEKILIYEIITTKIKTSKKNKNQIDTHDNINYIKKNIKLNLVLFNNFSLMILLGYVLLLILLILFINYYKIIIFFT